MTHVKNSLSAMSAIAAVLALATPAMAQDAQPAPVTTAPDPIGATPPSTDPVPSTAPAPSTTTAVDPLSATTAVETAPVSAPAAATRARTTPRRATTAPTPVRPATRAPAIPRGPVAASPTPTSPAPVEAIAPLVAPIVAATPPAVAAPTVQPLEAPPAESASSDVLPLAAAGGLGLLALLGAGVALRRRKRRAEEAEYGAYDEPAYEEAPANEPAFEEPRIPVAFAEPVREPAMTRAPVMAAPVMAAPVAAAAVSTPIDAPAQTLPDGFDLSRFGPHVQAAYRGPTEDNPSLSLKNRLRRASAMDQMARNEVETAQPVAEQPLAASAPTGDVGAVVSKLRPAPSSSGGFILGGDTTRPKPRPVTQH